MICADIVMRFFFNLPIHGVTDVVSMLIVACVFLQLGSTIGSGRLIRADFLLGHWSNTRPVFARIVDAAFHLTGAALLALGLAWLWRDMGKSYASDDFTGAVGAYTITVWPFKLGVVIGCAVALIVTLHRALALLAGIAPILALRTGGARLRALLPAVVFFGIVAGFLILNFTANLSPVMIGVLSLVGLLAAIATGMPIAFALLGLSFVGVWLTRNNMLVAENTLGISMTSTIRSYEFGVIPLFVMMGLILDKADVGRDAFQVAVTLLRGVRGGLGIATVGANALFASITGSSIASAAVFSRIAVPSMIEGGYTKRFAVGVVAGSSVLGMLIPPSLLLIIYGLIAEASIGKLFIAAILPGLLLAAAFAVLNIGLATFFPSFVGRPHKLTGPGLKPLELLTRLLPVLSIIVLVMGGIYAGVFTPTEAGAVGALGAFIVGGVRGKLTLATIRNVVLETGYISAVILFLIIAASFYARMLTLSTIPMQVTGALAGLDIGMFGFLAIYFVILVALGMILDSVSIMLIVLPIVLPIATALGGDPIWFGIITVISIEIGLLTPPLGLSVFVVKSSLPDGFITLGEIFIGAAPFVLTMALVVALLMAVPQISLALLP
ncbi:TRAP transporter large permease subunit [Breoghania sp. L-A4]|nr:TRAP transporter large permease subunit [Breoghania sp. L-A4]